MLTLANFRHEIDPTILQRGEDYFQDGQVSDLTEIEHGVWEATVFGTEVYDVTIARENIAENSLVSVCTCPYDWGPVCKHVAAVLYALEGMAKSTSGSPRKKSKPQQAQVIDVLKDTSREALVGFLVELAREDRQIANRILIRFDEDSQNTESYRRLIKEALKQGIGYDSYIDYSGARKAARSIHKFMDDAEADLQAGHVAKTIPLYQAVIETVAPEMNHADDSSGDLSSCIEIALENLALAGEQLSHEEQAALFEYCLSEAPKEPYKGWDWAWDLAQIAADLVSTDDQRQQLTQTLDRMTPIHKSDRLNFTADFYLERAQRIKLKLVERLEGEGAARLFLRENIGIDSFRVELAAYYMQSGNLAEAKRLCTEWLAQDETPRRGFATHFQTMLLEIAQQEANSDEIIKQAEALFLGSGNFDYFDLLKKTIGANEWPDYREQLIPKVEQRGGYGSLVLELYVREEMWQPFLERMQRSQRRNVERYRKPFEEQFPDEAAIMYEQFVVDLLSGPTGREIYQEACRYLRRMKKLGQEEWVEELVEKYRAKYPNRPALLDELKRV